MSKIVWGAKIFTDVATTNASIGLYAGEFRWWEEDIPGVSDPWKVGMIEAGGIAPISEMVKLRDGGSVATLRGTGIALDNTQQFFQTIKDLDIEINNLVCHIIEFEQQATRTIETVRFRGKTRFEPWNETRFPISVEPNYESRRALLTKTINTEDYPDADDKALGKVIPITYGQLEKAEFIRVANQRTEYRNYERQTLNEAQEIELQFGTDGDAFEKNIFPVVGNDGNDPPIQYTIAISKDGADLSWYKAGALQTSGTLDLNIFENDYYLQVVKGDGAGKFRKIESAEVQLAPQDESRLLLTLTDYFEDPLTGNATATDQDNSWVKMVKFDRDYQCDVQNLKSYLDVDLNEVDQGFPIFVYAEDKQADVGLENEPARVVENEFSFIQIPEYSYTAITGGENNSVEVDMKMFNEDPDIALGFYIMPVTRMQFMTDANLSAYTGMSSPDFSAFEKRGDGIYVDVNEPGASGRVLGPTFDFDDVVDKKFGSARFFNTEVNPGDDDNYVIAMESSLPELPQGLTFDSVHLGFVHQCEFRGNPPFFPEGIVHFIARSFMGNLNEFYRPENKGRWIFCDSLPDFYYLDDRSTKNENFYVNRDNVITDTPSLFVLGRLSTGYEIFQITNVSDRDSYEQIAKIGYFVFVNVGAYTNNVSRTRNKLTEVAIVFKRTASIKENIYIPMNGRILNDSWGGRRLSGSMINNPIDILEDLNRYQDWTETGDTVTLPGVEQSANALINTKTGSGGFDDRFLKPIKDLRPAFQITDESKAWSDMFKTKLCETFFLASFVNESAEESVVYIAPDPDDIVVTDAITMFDIKTDETIGTLKRRKPEEIYSEPIINYNYSQARSRYQSIIEIKNAHVGTWQADFTPGLSGDTAERIYDLYHELWLLSRQKNPTPKRIQDQPFIRTLDDAVWYLETLARWQKTSKIKIPVYYNKAKNYHIGKFVSLTLPHHTDGATVKCTVEGFEKDKTNNRVELDLVILTDLVGSDYWQDNMSEEFDDIRDTPAQTPQIEDIQDIT